MKKDEHKAILEQLRTCTSDADRMGLLLQLEQDYTSVLTERDTANTRATTAEQEANKFAKLNNELWLQNSSQQKIGAETPLVDDGDKGGQEPPQKRTFEDLESKF